MSKLVLDTNVLIYGLDVQSSFYQSAVQILTEPKYDLFVPIKVISEFFAVCSKINIPLSDALRFYKELLINTRILYPNEKSLSHFEELIKKYQPRGNRVFDLEIVSIAVANGITQIATANFKDFQGVTEIEAFTLAKS